MGDKSLEEMTAETLSGDLRDAVLTHVRSMQTPWSKMSEQAQADKIYAISNVTETIVRRAVAIIAARDMQKIFCKITKFTVKDGIKAELMAVQTTDNIELIAENLNQAGILVFASPDEFLGQKAAAKPDKDQPDLPIDDSAEADDESEQGGGAELKPMEPAPDESGLTPFEQGEGAAKHGLDLSHNPFEQGSEAWSAWRDGFNFAVGADAPPADKADEDEGQPDETEDA